MIELNLDYTLLSRFFGIPTSRLHMYANKDIEEIMKLEEEQGNEKASEYKKILSDPDKLLQIFRLSNIENKYIILRNMSEDDLDDLLPYLKSDQLIKGLQFFTDEKLMALCEALPTEELVGVIFEKFALLDVLDLMKEQSLDKFLQEPDVERKYAQNYFDRLDRESLEQIMIHSFGYEYKDKDRKEYLEKLEGLNEQKYNEFLMSMEKNSKMNLINGIVEQDEDLLLLFKNDDLVRPMDKLMKEDKIKMMSVLEPEFLIPMIQELPIDLTQIVLTQIDPRDFSEILARDFQDILSQVVMFSEDMFG